MSAPSLLLLSLLLVSVLVAGNGWERERPIQRLRPHRLQAGGSGKNNGKSAPAPAPAAASKTSSKTNDDTNFNTNTNVAAKAAAFGDSNNLGAAIASLSTSNVPTNAPMPISVYESLPECNGTYYGWSQVGSGCPVSAAQSFFSTPFGFYTCSRSLPCSIRTCSQGNDMFGCDNLPLSICTSAQAISPYGLKLQCDSNGDYCYQSQNQCVDVCPFSYTSSCASLQDFVSCYSSYTTPSVVRNVPIDTSGAYFHQKVSCVWNGFSCMEGSNLCA